MFNKEGCFLYKVQIDQPSLVFRNGYIYGPIINPETGYIKVKRFKIKNWEHIKEGIE